MDDLVAKGEAELEALVEQVPEEVLDYIVDLEERVVKAEDATPQNEQSAIEKALSDLDPEVAKAFVDQRTRLEAAELALQAEKIEKADAVWVTKARAVDGLIDSPEDFGKELRTVAETNPDLAKSIMSTLTAASERLAKADLYVEIGHNAAAAGSASEKIQNIAKAAVEADPTKSQAEAETEAWEANPGLYDEHVTEARQALKS